MVKKAMVFHFFGMCSFVQMKKNNNKKIDGSEIFLYIFPHTHAVPRL